MCHPSIAGQGNTWHQLSRPCPHNLQQHHWTVSWFKLSTVSLFSFHMGFLDVDVNGVLFDAGMLFADVLVPWPHGLVMMSVHRCLGVRMDAHACMLACNKGTVTNLDVWDTAASATGAAAVTSKSGTTCMARFPESDCPIDCRR
jgi:hypothetical protein